MKLRLPKMVSALLLVLPFSLLLTCAQQEDPAKMKIQTLLAEGKTALGTANYDDAVQSFQLILNEYDPENPEAMYGVAIALTVKQLAGMGDQFKSIIDMVFQMLPTLTTSKTPLKLTPQAASSGINAIVESVIDDTLLDAINSIFPYWDKLKQHPEFSMTIDKLPAQIGVAPYLVYKVDIGGVQDIGTVYFISGLARLAKAVIYLVYSLNLDLTASLPGLIQQFLPMLQNPEGLTITIDRDFIFSLLAYIIDSSPNFMTLEPNVGTQRLNEAADLMALAIQDLLNCLDSISKETGLQSNHLVGYKSEGSKSYLVFNIKQEDGTLQSIPIEFSDQFRTSLQNLISSFQSTGGVRASWAQDFAPFVGIMVQAALQSGLLDPVLAFALPMLETYIGQETIAMINQLMGTVKQLAQSGVISGAITTIIPDAIQFDFGKFMHSPPPKFLRLILPAVVTDQEGKKQLLIEYECTDLAGNSLWCPYPDTVTSSAHFIGTAFEIPDDGIENTLPYLSSQDPSIGGLLYLNLSSLDPSFANEFHQPTSYEFNYFLAKVVGGLLGGLGNITSGPGNPAITRRSSGS